MLRLALPANRFHGNGVPQDRIRIGRRPRRTTRVEHGALETAVLDDNWTVVTADGTLSAHFEHTVGLTEDGPVVFTA